VRRAAFFSGGFMQEDWRPVVGYEGLYEVSDHGRVRSLDRIDTAGRRLKGKILSQCLSGRKPDNTYRVVKLSDAPRSKTACVHVLVAEAFHGPRPEGFHAAHHDGNREHNTAINIRWKTVSDNQLDRLRHGTGGQGSANPRARLKESDIRTVRALSADYTQADIALLFGVSRRTVGMILTGDTWTHV